MNHEEAVNREHWNELAEVHYRAYRLNPLRQGKPLLDEITLQEVGDVQRKSLLHLHCHIGSDTLSWALLGAKVTGVDFSESSIVVAKRLANECGLEARWIVSDILSLPKKHDEQYDIVFASQGVVCWISDLKRWMRVAAHYLKPGGVFYLMDSHPLMNIFDREQPEYKIAYSYFSTRDPICYSGGGFDYSDEKFWSKGDTYEWIWPLGDIVTAAAEAGLHVEFLHEYDQLFYRDFSYLVEMESGWWKHPLYGDKMPLLFTLRASKL